MYYVYLLQSRDTGKIYTGFTANLKERIRKHLSKGVYSTKRMGTVRLIFYEAFLSEKDARRRENYLKTTKGKRAVKIMLTDHLEKMAHGPIV